MTSSPSEVLASWCTSPTATHARPPASTRASLAGRTTPGSVVRANAREVSTPRCTRTTPHERSWSWIVDFWSGFHESTSSSYCAGRRTT